MTYLGVKDIVASEIGFRFKHFQNAFVLLSLLRKEGASKSLPKLLIPKTGHKLVRSGVTQLIPISI